MSIPEKSPKGSRAKVQECKISGRSMMCTLLGVTFLIVLGTYMTWGITVSKHVYHPQLRDHKVPPPKVGTDLDTMLEHAHGIIREAEQILEEHHALQEKSREGIDTTLHEPGDFQRLAEKTQEATSLVKLKAQLGQNEPSLGGQKELHGDQSFANIHSGADEGHAKRSSGMPAVIPASNRADVVLGMAQETDPKNLIVFCASLREVSEADVVIFVNTPIPKLHLEIAEKYKVTLKPYDLTTLSKTLRSFHPSTLRWGMMHKYLTDSSMRNRYGRVWMIDVRDSFFQGNPFEMLPKGQGGFYTFKGVEDKTIGSCGWNGPWISDCFSAKTYGLVRNNNIICSGVSMGDIDSAVEYLRLMSGLIQGTGEESIQLGSKFPSCERNGVDQGVHNVLVHTKSIPELKIFDHNSGPVANLQAKRSIIKGSRVTNRQGDAVAVVHQYDRNPKLQSNLFKKYVYWVDTNDPAAEWAYEETCAKFDYKNDMDMFKGSCDLKMQGGATSAASCCKYCSQNPGCKAFTYWSAKCFLKSCRKENHSGSGVLTGAVSGWLKSGS